MEKREVFLEPLIQSYVLSILASPLVEDITSFSKYTNCLMFLELLLNLSIALFSGATSHGVLWYFLTMLGGILPIATSPYISLIQSSLQ